MFEVALLIGIFSYAIYFIGLLGLLYKLLLIGFSLLFWLCVVFWKRKLLTNLLVNFSFPPYGAIFYLALIYIVLQALVNIVGLFGPEIGFDATWYHLTLPKLYLFYHSIVHFPSGILYYSDLPKFAEMLFTAGLAFGSDFFARGVQFVFGILTCIILYRLGRKFLSPAWAILIPVIFYSNLVVGWESISGYIDLVRTFYASIALLALLNWRETKNKTYFYFSAVFVGFTIATKLLALPDLVLYSLALMFFDKKTLDLTKRIQRVTLFLVIALVLPLPYFAFSFAHTGNPIFPMLSKAYPLTGYWQILSPIYLINAFWQTFAYSSDPVNPIFLALLPFTIIYWKKIWKGMPIPTFFAVWGLIAWYLTPQTGGGRYLLPYLSSTALVSVYVVGHMNSWWKKFFLFFILIVAGISLAYRGVANAKFIPLFLHKQSQAQFMANHLQFTIGDFYDIDGYFARHIKPTDRVLLYGFHNLYYVNFPFVDSDWVQKGDKFDYVAVQGKGLPLRFAYWNLVYYNSTTLVRLYSLKGQMWYY